MAHRWGANKVAKWEARMSQWDLSSQDGFEDFLGTLPEPIAFHQRGTVNPKGTSPFCMIPRRGCGSETWATLQGLILAF